MSISDLNPARRAIFAACREAGLDDAARHDVQMAATGKASIRDMDAADLARVLDHLKARAGGAARPRPAAPHAYQRKVYALWGELKRQGVWREDGVGSLWRFAARAIGMPSRDGVVGVARPEVMDPKDCNSVIEALKQIGDRAGLTPGWEKG